MKALVYHGADKRAWKEKPKPVIKDSTDAIVKITKTTICGTDLHIMKGDVPEVMERLILEQKGLLEFDGNELCISVLGVNNKALITYHRLQNLKRYKNIKSI